MAALIVAVYFSSVVPRVLAKAQDGMRLEDLKNVYSVGERLK